MLCIGVAEYATGPGAPFADSDARAVGERLRDLLGPYDPQVAVLENAQATGAAIRGWMDDRRGEGLRREDHVWIVFAGRGATDESGEPYLLPHDGSIQDPRRTAVPLRELAAAVKGAGELTVILDCAFQGRLDERGPGTDVPAIGARQVLGSSARVLAAAWGEGEATDRAAKGHGLFTSFFLEALDGGADGDGDGRTTLAEVRDHLADNVRREARRYGVDERPALLSGSPRDDLVPERR